MRDVLEKPRAGLLVAAALATLGGLAIGWGGVVFAFRDAPASGETERPEPLAGIELSIETAEPDFHLMMTALEEAGLRIIPESALLRLSEPVIRPDGRLSDAVAEALMLSETETVAMNRAIAEADISLREAELDRMEILEESEFRTVFRFDGLREEGAAVERTLRDRVVGELGRWDGRMLWALLTRDENGSGDDYWNGFGRQTRIVVFERTWMERDNGSGTAELRFAAGSAASDEESGEARVGVEAGTVVRIERIRIKDGEPETRIARDFAGRYSYLVEFLPDAFHRYFRSGE